MQGDALIPGTEDRAVAGHLHGVGGAAVVETWHEIDRETHLPTHDPQNPDQPVPVGRPGRVRDGHEVEEFTHAAGGQEAGDKNRAVR